MEAERAEKLRFTLASPGWFDCLQPMFEQEIAAAQQAMALTEPERASPKFSDDFLRGYLRGLIFAARRPAMLLHETEQEETTLRTAATSEVEGVGDPYSPLKTG